MAKGFDRASILKAGVRLCRSAAALALVLCVFSFAAAPAGARAWDTTKPRGHTRVIDFMTSEGTSMSVDISPDGSWVVFDMLGQIYRVPASGGTAECLTQESGIALNYHPRYSPDGKSIAFVSDRNSVENIWVMDAAGGRPRIITNDPEPGVRLLRPVWTPDGRNIVAHRVGLPPPSIDRTSTIWSYPIDGGPPERLPGEGYQAWPSISPDGRYLYVHTTKDRASDAPGGADTHHRIERIELENGTTRILFGSKHHQVGPSLEAVREMAPEPSPDGRWLAFARRIPDGSISYRGHRFGPRTALWLRDLKTGSERILMDPISLDWSETHFIDQTEVLPGYSWAKDSQSLVISEGGKIRRVFIANGRIATIPFTARVHRVISQKAAVRLRITDEPVAMKFLRWPATSPDGSELLFEANGWLWRVPGSGGAPRRLTDFSDDVLELTPAWSPDGQWIAFTTWSDEEGGQLWKMRAAGGAPERVTLEAGEYIYPTWAGDGRSIIVTAGAGATRRHESWEDNPYFELLRFSAVGGTPRKLAEVAGLTRAMPGADGRIYFSESGRSTPGDKRTGVALSSIRSDGGDRKVHAVYAYADDLTLSPSGKWVALARENQLFLLPYDPSRVRFVPLHDPAERRVTWEGGLFPAWRYGDVLESISGNRFNRYDANSGRTQSIDISLAVPRAALGGTLALANARLITLENRQVIERGSLIVRGGRILCVGQCDASKADRIIDLGGKTIIPGLIDAHAHRTPWLFNPSLHEQTEARYLAYGVTTTIDPSVPSSLIHPRVQLIETGRMTGPRIYTTGDPIGPFLDPIESLDHARHEVNRIARWGSPILKEFRNARRDQRQWLLEAARENRIAVTAEGEDLPFMLGFTLDGYTGWEHALSDLPLYRDAAEFFGQGKMVYSPTSSITSVGPFPLELYRSQIDSWNLPKEQRFVPGTELMRFRLFASRPIDRYSFPLLAEGALDIKRAGGEVAIGGHGEQDGIASHWDMWNYVPAAGMMGALEIGAQGAAHMLGLENEIGSLKAGKVADLIVLNSDPLENIRNTLDIAYVMKGGALYSGDTLDQLWPVARPYGRRPWYHPQIFRNDVRPIGSSIEERPADASDQN